MNRHGAYAHDYPIDAPAVADRTADHAQIEADVAAYLARGGTIEPAVQRRDRFRIPPGHGRDSNVRIMVGEHPALSELARLAINSRARQRANRKRREQYA